MEKAVDGCNHKKISFITYTQTLNAQTMMSFTLSQRTVLPPIYLVLDNAKYQYCKLVEELAKTLAIHLFFLPPYSPHLNCIERL